MKKLFFKIIFIKSFLFSFGGFGFNSGVSFFEIKPSLNSNIKIGNTNVAQLTNHGFKNSINYGGYFIYPYQDIEIEFLFNKLKKEYQFSFKNQLGNSNYQESKLYNFNFNLENYYLNLNKNFNLLNYKTFFNSYFLISIGLGLNRGTPIVDNKLFELNDSLFVFDGDGKSDLKNGTLSLLKLEEELNRNLIGISYNFNLHSGLRAKIFNIEIFCLYKLIYPTKTLKGDDLISNIKNFGSLNFRLGLMI